MASKSARTPWLPNCPAMECERFLYCFYLCKQLKHHYVFHSHRALSRGKRLFDLLQTVCPGDHISQLQPPALDELQNLPVLDQACLLYTSPGVRAAQLPDHPGAGHFPPPVHPGGGSPVRPEMCIRDRRAASPPWTGCWPTWRANCFNLPTPQKIPQNPLATNHCLHISHPFTILEAR